MIKDVGIGTFGRVVECWDRYDKRKVAIKVVRRIKKYTESARIEADILRDVNACSEAGSELLVKMYCHFEFRGRTTNGNVLNPSDAVGATQGTAASSSSGSDAHYTTSSRRTTIARFRRIVCKISRASCCKPWRVYTG